MNNRTVDLQETMLNVLNEAAFVYDQDMNIKHFNAAAEKITGHKKEDVVGKKCVTLFDRSLCLNNCELCMTVKQKENKGKVSFQSSFVRKDGIKRVGLFNAGRIRQDANGDVEVLVALTDITEVTQLKRRLRDTRSFRNIIGKSYRMQELFETIRNVALYDSTVFIHGESGTGKELAAQSIHDESARAGEKLIKVNCSAFSPNLLESELFGHARGAFTGASRDRVGRFEEAHGGTIFLDEVGDLDPQIQVKLLRVLQEREIERVGENKIRKVDIRIIAATNKIIETEVKAGRFREDLYYRLNVIPITLPPLRERQEDIPLLANHFLSLWGKGARKAVVRVSGEALRLMMDYQWPGNVRELENAVEHACVKCSGEIILPKDLPGYLAPVKKASGLPRPRVSRQRVLTALRETGYNQTRAARLLNLHRTTLWRKMKKWDITV